DTPRFLRLIERLAIAANSPIFPYFSHEVILPELSGEGIGVLEKMLHHANANVQTTALAVLHSVGPKAAPLKQAVLKLAKGQNAELAEKAVWTLAEMEAGPGEDTAPDLLSKFQNGTVTLRQLANAAGSLEIRDPAIQAILEYGLHDKDKWTANSCA